MNEMNRTTTYEIVEVKFKRIEKGTRHYWVFDDPWVEAGISHETWITDSSFVDMDGNPKPVEPAIELQYGRCFDYVEFAEDWHGLYFNPIGEGFSDRAQSTLNWELETTSVKDTFEDWIPDLRAMAEFLLTEKARQEFRTQEHDEICFLTLWQIDHTTEYWGEGHEDFVDWRLIGHLDQIKLKALANSINLEILTEELKKVEVKQNV